MYYFFTQAHDGWRYLVILALVVAVAVYLVNWLRGRTWSQLERRIGLYTVIVVDIQLLFGLILWGMAASMGIVGANAARTLEHPFTMLIAIALLHIGWIWTKKADEAVRLRNGSLTFIIVVLLVLAGLTRVGGIL